MMPRVETGDSPVHAAAKALIALIPPLQRRMIIVTSRSILAGLIAGRSPPQTWLTAILIIDHLAPVFERSQTRFHVVEFRCRHRVFRTRRQDLLNLLLRLGNAVGSLWMRSESLSQRSRLLLFHPLQFLEEGNKRLRVVSRLVHVLQA